MKKARYKAPKSVWLNLHEMSGIGKSMEKSGLVVAGAGGEASRRVGSDCYPGPTFLFGVIEMFWN